MPYSLESFRNMPLCIAQLAVDVHESPRSPREPRKLAFLQVQEIAPSDNLPPPHVIPCATPDRSEDLSEGKTRQERVARMRTQTRTNPASNRGNCC